MAFHFISWCPAWCLLRLGAPSAEGSLDGAGSYVRLRCRKTLLTDVKGVNHSTHRSFPDHCGRLSKRLPVRHSGSPRCHLFPSHHHFGSLSWPCIGIHYPSRRPSSEGGKIISCIFLHYRNQIVLLRDLGLRTHRRRAPRRIPSWIW